MPLRLWPNGIKIIYSKLTFFTWEYPPNLNKNARLPKIPSRWGSIFIKQLEDYWYVLHVLLQNDTFLKQDFSNLYVTWIVWAPVWPKFVICCPLAAWCLKGHDFWSKGEFFNAPQLVAAHAPPAHVLPERPLGAADYTNPLPFLCPPHPQHATLLPP